MSQSRDVQKEIEKYCRGQNRVSNAACTLFGGAAILTVVGGELPAGIVFGSAAYLAYKHGEQAYEKCVREESREISRSPR